MQITLSKKFLALAATVAIAAIAFGALVEAINDVAIPQRPCNCPLSSFSTIALRNELRRRQHGIPHSHIHNGFDSEVTDGESDNEDAVVSSDNARNLNGPVNFNSHNRNRNRYGYCFNNRCRNPYLRRPNHPHFNHKYRSHGHKDSESDSTDSDPDSEVDSSSDSIEGSSSIAENDNEDES